MIMTAKKAMIKVSKETEADLAQNFIKAYSELCKKHGYKLISNPVFQARDDNTFSVVIQTSVEKII